MATIPVGEVPEAIAYDSAQDEMFVANTGSANVSVISDSTNRVVASVPVGSYGSGGYSGMAYDPVTDQVFVSRPYANNVSIISAGTDTVAENVQLSDPFGVAYDTVKEELFVADCSNPGSVTVINGASDSVASTIAFPGNLGPCRVAYDSGKGEVFVANAVPATGGSQSYVNVLSDATNTIVATITLNNSSEGVDNVAYDSRTGEIFITDFGADRVFVASDQTNTVLSTLAGFVSPAGLIYDPETSDVLVTNSYWTNVNVISDTTDGVWGNITVGKNPVAGAYDSRSGAVYIVNAGSDTVSVLAPVLTGEYALSVGESGLPMGFAWSMVVNGTNQSSTGSSMLFAVPNGTYAFTVAKVPGYEANLSSGTITVQGGAIALALSFRSLTPPFTVLEDDFATDAALNSSLWEVDGSVLDNITQAEATDFGSGLSMVVPSPPVGALALSGQGLTLGASGSYVLDGVTTLSPLIPPFSVEVRARANGSASGNPVAIFLSNASAQSLLGVFASASVYVQNGSQAPVSVMENPPSSDYVVFLNATWQQYVVTVLSGGARAVASGVWPQPPLGGDFLSLGDYAGAFSGELAGATFVDSVTYLSVAVTSNQTWDLDVAVQSTAGSPEGQVSVDVTQIGAVPWLSTNLTAPNGTAFFVGLPEGDYSVVAVQAAGTGAATNATAALPIGNPDRPTVRIVDVNLTVAPPPLSPLTAAINSSGGTTGYAPFADRLAATATGWVGNYSYLWAVDGSTAGTASILEYTFPAPGEYTVALQVVSAGLWYGLTVPANSTIADITVDVFNTSFATSFAPTQGYLSNTPFKSTQYVQLSSGGLADEGIAYFSTSGTFLTANVTPAVIPGFSLPSWLLDLGFSTPYYELDVNDSVASTTTGSLFQLGSTVPVNLSLPAGAPDSPGDFVGYRFTLRFDPYASEAEAADAAGVILGTLGISRILSPSTFEALQGAARGFLLPLFSGAAEGLGASIGAAVARVVAALPGFEAFLSSWASAADLAPAVSSALLATAVKICTAVTVAKFAFNLGTVFGAILAGGIREDFSVSGLARMTSIEVSGSDGVPDVLVDPALGTFGWKGGWVSGLGPFAHSAYSDSGYSFAVLVPDTFTLSILPGARAGSVPFAITVAENGSSRTLVGVLGGGSSSTYIVTYSDGNLTFTPVVERPGEITASEAEMLVGAGGSVAAVCACGALVARRRKRTALRGDTPPER